MIILTTPRLYLRQWRDSDLPAFAAMNADPEVMRYFPNVLSRAESDAVARRCQRLIAEQGWGFWVVEHRETGAFIGMVGLHEPKPTLPCAPCVEIGWRIHRDHWRQGYAFEAACSALDFAFTALQLTEVVAFTARLNVPSQALMRRLGMVDTQQDFLHPDLDPSHPLAPHVLFSAVCEVRPDTFTAYQC